MILFPNSFDRPVHEGIRERGVGKGSKEGVKEGMSRRRSRRVKEGFTGKGVPCTPKSTLFTGKGVPFTPKKVVVCWKRCPFLHQNIELFTGKGVLFLHQNIELFTGKGVLVHLQIWSYLLEKVSLTPAKGVPYSLLKVSPSLPAKGVPLPC